MILVIPTPVDREPFLDRLEMSVSAHVHLACLVTHTGNVNLSVLSTLTVLLTKHAGTINVMIHALEHVDRMLNVKLEITLHCAHVYLATLAML